MKARIVRDDGSLCGINEPGELWVSGGNVALGYFHNEKATRETFVTLEDGERWLRTGDMFRLGEDGMAFL
jgi:acyl-CoA synthetase (AMP-forming)/AMP-acid ligase II